MLLTFVIVWGGPNGVELAGAIAELAKRALAAGFRYIDPTSACILPCEAGERVLPAFPETLSRYAGRALARLGLEVKLKSPVTDCGPWGVTVGTERVEAATVEFGVRVKTGLSDGDRSIYLVRSFYSDPELAGLELPEGRTIEYDEEALHHFEGDL